MEEKLSLTLRDYVYGVPQLVRLSLGVQVDIYCTDKLSDGRLEQKKELEI